MARAEVAALATAAGPVAARAALAATAVITVLVGAIVAVATGAMVGSALGSFPFGDSPRIEVGQQVKIAGFIQS